MTGRKPKPIGRNGDRASEHFGRQMRKARESHGWTLTELGRRMDVDPAHLGRVENGTRPPTEKLALACDKAFPERDGWFSEWYEDSRSWVPAGFRSWAEHEDKATHLSVWTPGICHGLAQEEGYAREVLALEPGATEDQIQARLAARMARQKRILYRDEPPMLTLLVDHAAVYREVGSPAVMVAQLEHLVRLTTLPRVTVQLLPQVGHPATQSGIILADDTAAYTEHLISGAVYTNGDALVRLQTIMHNLQAEAYRASESLTRIREAIERWNAK